MNSSNTEILDLWPTKLVRKKLDDIEDPNRELLKLVREWDKTNKRLTTDYRDNNPFEVDSSATNWLRAQINQLVIEYLQTIKIEILLEMSCYLWHQLDGQKQAHRFSKPRCWFLNIRKCMTCSSINNLVQPFLV